MRMCLHASGQMHFSGQGILFFETLYQKITIIQYNKTFQGSWALLIPGGGTGSFPALSKLKHGYR